MKVSIDQVRKVLETTKSRPGFAAETLFEQDLTVSEDAALIRTVRDQIMAMPEVRAELVEEIKARVARGEYNPSAEDIVEAMIRRTIADRAR
jgi:flagellar biosynthesis anti-sigma factor FlgM